ncbi:restriction endonuclease [Pseudofrankia saprophytica]|uniref:restriction endonuclease n=1 Tax=Pseudofrankia saprophytica TaxID=298655 RepID=UPI000234D8CA
MEPVATPPVPRAATRRRVTAVRPRPRRRLRTGRLCARCSSPPGPLLPGRRRRLCRRPAEFLDLGSSVAPRDGCARPWRAVLAGASCPIAMPSQPASILTSCKFVGPTWHHWPVSQNANLASPEPPKDLLSRAEIETRRHDWARFYIKDHRTRRLISGIGAFILAVPVAILLVARVGVLYGSTAALGPIALTEIARETNRLGFTYPRAWISAWIFALFDGLFLLLTQLSDGEALRGSLLLVAAISAMATISIGHFIPSNVELEGKLPPLPSDSSSDYVPEGVEWPLAIITPEDAERVSASWLQKFGYRDAVVTPRGTDDGIDVWSAGAVAQTKFWTRNRVGIPEVQRLVGSSEPGQRRIFFSTSGYTKPALRWSSDSDHQVALFTLYLNGHIKAQNYFARDLIWSTPINTPVALRKPLKLSTKIIFTSLSAIYPLAGCALLVAAFLVPQTVQMVFLLAISAISFILPLAIVNALLSADFRRLVKALRGSTSGSAWPGWRQIFTDETLTSTNLLPSDLYFGAGNFFFNRVYRHSRKLVAHKRLWSRRIAAKRYRNRDSAHQI